MVRTFFARIVERLEMTKLNTDELVAEGDTAVIFRGEAAIVEGQRRDPGRR